MAALKLQGQIQGLDLAIDAVFEIANYQTEEQDDDGHDTGSRAAA